jgi:hypothetical protein
MYCPYCNEELFHHDIFGLGTFKGIHTKKGDIYKCENEKCNMLGERFFTLKSEKDDVLHEGMPC